MNVLLIEDEPQAATRLQTLLRKINPAIKVLKILDSVKRSVEWFSLGGKPDLVFMDIQLADGLSFEIFESVKVPFPVIFVTAYDEYALKAFKVNSIDYILKPIDEEELKNALTKFGSVSGQVSPSSVLESIGYAMEMLNRKYKERFVTKVGEHLKFINVSDILFFYSEDKITFCKTNDGRKHILDFTLDQVNELVNPNAYYRINRKYIINADSISDLISHTNSRLKVVLKTSDDADIIVARERVQEFKEWLDR